MVQDLEKLRQHVEERLTPARYAHSIAVQRQAAKLARRYGADWFKASIAGLLHDVCHDMDSLSQLNYLRSCGILLDILALENPPVWHAICGAVYARDALGIRDEEVLDAIRYHTTGRREMTALEQVIYVADLTSEDRQFPGVDEYRRLAERSLDEVLHASLRHTLRKLTEEGRPIVEDAWGAYNYYCLQQSTRGK